MAEHKPRRDDSATDDLDLNPNSGIGVYISIGHNNSYQTTNNRASGSHTRNIMMDGGSNNHVGNDAHDDSTAISGTSKHCRSFRYPDLEG